MKEQDIINKIKSGNTDIYEFLFRKYYQLLCHFAVKYVKDADEAEELVQETFVTIWKKREYLNITSSIKSYLYQCVRNACLNHIKHNQVKLQYEKHQINQTNAIQETDSVVTLELETKIKDSLEKLPPERKKIFLMNRNEGLKYREIADKLNISIKTVENQMGKALKFLKEELQEYLVIVFLILAEILKKL